MSSIKNKFVTKFGSGVLAGIWVPPPNSTLPSTLSPLYNKPCISKLGKKIFRKQKYFNTILTIGSVLSLIGVLKVHKILNNSYIAYNTCFSTLLVDKFHKGLHQNCFSALVDINFKFWLWFILAIHKHVDSVCNPAHPPAPLCRAGRDAHDGPPHCHGRRGGTGCIIRWLPSLENVKDTLFMMAKRFQRFFVK